MMTISPLVRYFNEALGVRCTNVSKAPSAYVFSTSIRTQKLRKRPTSMSEASAASFESLSWLAMSETSDQEQQLRIRHQQRRQLSHEQRICHRIRRSERGC